VSYSPFSNLKQTVSNARRSNRKSTFA